MPQSSVVVRKSDSNERLIVLITSKAVFDIKQGLRNYELSWTMPVYRIWRREEWLFSQERLDCMRLVTFLPTEAPVKT